MSVFIVSFIFVELANWFLLSYSVAFCTPLHTKGEDEQLLNEDSFEPQVKFNFLKKQIARRFLFKFFTKTKKPSNCLSGLLPHSASSKVTQQRTFSYMKQKR